jgi:hypothetical protein
MSPIFTSSLVGPSVSVRNPLSSILNSRNVKSQFLEYDLIFPAFANHTRFIQNERQMNAAKLAVTQVLFS